MTVEELIKELQKHPKSRRVVLYDDEYSSYIDLTEVNEQVVHEVQNKHRKVISHESKVMIVL